MDDIVAVPVSKINTCREQIQIDMDCIIDALNIKWREGEFDELLDRVCTSVCNRFDEMLGVVK